MRAPVNPSNVKGCIGCPVIWKDAQGSYDNVTGEWLPDKPVKHIRLYPLPDCPIHPSMGCYACDDRMVLLRPFLIPFGLYGSWALRADHQVAACPLHLKEMPPYHA